MPFCPKCVRTRTRAQFVKDASRPSGLGRWCKLCHRGYVAEWRSRHPEAVVEMNRRNKARRKYQYRTRYGITPERYDAMSAAQEGKCAICAKQYPEGMRLDVDHCHTTGTVRGLLCRGCNTSIGKLRDDPVLLRRAASYIEGKL
jgi:hypothetical protein